MSITPDQALRYLAYRAAECRNHDMHEALCLLPPALLRVLSLEPMDYHEAAAFQSLVRHTLLDRDQESSAGRFQ